MLKKRYFKTKDECEVTFEVPGDEANQVDLVCELNDWEPIPLKQVKGGPFRTRVRFPKNSRHEFRYRVDGERWVNDDAADAYVTNEFGSDNSVLEIKAEA